MLNFNVNPYNDDFDPNNNYHRILFRPGRAVQARELTQSQTILQDQISSFASAIYSQNTPISGGKVTINLKCNYIKLNTQYLGVDVIAGDYLNKIITDPTGTVLAKVIATAEGVVNGTTIVEYPTLIVNYLSGIQFTDEMVITPTDGTNISAQTIGASGGTTCSGVSSVASISEGIYYVVNGYSLSSIANADGTYSKYSIGNFVRVQPYTIPLNKYDNTPTYRVGLSISESYADYVSNPDLLDPAVDATNYQAPGADRYTITLSLTTLPLEVGGDSNFIELVRIESGNIVKQVDNTVYSAIDDYFAKRTYDTSGDYIVNNFKLTPTANTSDSSLYDISVGKGVAYVRGYRMENQSETKLTGNRARQSKTVVNNGTYVSYGNFVYVNSVVGSANGDFDITTMPAVDLHTVGAGSIVSTNTHTYNATVAATARIRNLEFDHYGSLSNTASYVYKAYLFDVAAKTLSSNASAATSTTITFYDTNSTFSTVTGAYVGATISIDSGTSFGDFRKITAYNGTTKVATVDQAFSTTPTTTSQFTVRMSVSNAETVAVANSTFAVLASSQIDNTSKVGGIATGDVQFESTDAPELLFAIGRPYVKTTTDSSYESQQVFRKKNFGSVSGTTTLSVSLTPDSINFLGRTTPSYLSASEITSLFTVVVRNKGSNSGLVNGQILDFTNTPDRKVQISSDKKTATFVAADLSTPLQVDVIAKVEVINADDSVNVLKSKNLVLADESAVHLSGTAVNTYTHVTQASGQVYIEKAGLVAAGSKQSLYVADVKRIVKIIDTGSSGTPANLSMLSNSAYDVTSYFNFNNGQTDNYYDHASIILKPGAPMPRGNLLVLFDYYSHGGGDGYYSVMSYLSPVSSSPESYASIPNYTTKKGTVYALRDSLDFRPSRQNATSSFVFEYTTDPATTDVGSLIPTDLSVFTSDYSYYLPKKDLLVLSKDRVFKIIEGASSNDPTFPTEPDGSLVLGQITLDPYTAYVPGEGPVGSLPNLSLQSVAHKRWTMQDISDLQKRINNIEYYTALNVLEQKASSLQVPDVNGINRFKNGILVDDFSSFATADTSNPDFSASINKRTRQLTAEQTVTNFPLQSSALVAAGGSLAKSSVTYNVSQVNKTTNLFTLPFTTANVAKQQLASSTVNVNPFGTAIIQGTLDLNPPMDNWVDNTKSPDLLIVDPNLQVFQQSEKVNQLSTGDWKVVPGTTTTSVSQVTSSFNRLNHGAFNGPFGNIVGYTQTDTKTTTQTYGTMSQVNTLGYYSNIGSTYSINNNYITDISILPYIRPQQLLVKAKGLLVNTPISTWFDGTNVDNYMTSPDIIELNNAVGTFNEGDTIGYYQSNKFYPIATVVSTYQYPNSSKVRLYIAGNYHTAYAADIAISKIQNAFLDATGAYTNSTASGSIISSKIISVHKSGYVASVGGTFTDVLGSSIRYYRVSVNHGAFADAYGIWGDPAANGTTLPRGKFNFTAPTSGNYYLRVSADDNQTGFIKVNGTTYWTATATSGANYDYTVPLNAGTNTFEISVTSSEQDGDAYIAAAISSAAWQNGTTTNGTVVFGTDSLKGQTAPLNAGTQIEMPGGGLYYVGATKVSLNGIANSTDNFYTGSKIKFNSVYISVDAFGKSTVTPQTFTATITAYEGATCTATLDTPVNISVGGNAIIGGTDTTSFYTIDGTQTSYQMSVQRGGLSKLSTDESGSFIGIFNIPQGVFKTGDRVLRVDNRTVATEPTTATTFSEGTFTASGLATKSQALDFGASVSGARNTFAQTKYLSNQYLGATVTTQTSYSPWDPIAQSFMFSKETYPNGLFLDSISLYFQSKPTTTNTPITLSIVNTLNGYPNGETLDYSIVTMTPDKIKTSSTPHYLDPNAKTVFKFDAPVYVQAGQLYAFILKSNSTEYNVYLAGQNGTALPSSAKANYTDANPTTTTKIGTAPYVGALFESQNSITWTADQTKSLMMVFDRCVFETGTRTLPFVIPNKLPYRKNANDDIRYALDPNKAPNLLNAYAGVDVLSDAFNVTTTDFVPGATNIGYTYSATLASGHNKTDDVQISPGKYGSPTYDDIYLSDGQGERVLLANSNSSFSLTASITTTDNSVSPVISDDGLSLYNIQWNINNFGVSNSQIILTNGGAGYNSPTPNANVVISAPDQAGGTQAYAQAVVVDGVVQSIYVTNTGSGYLVAPTITIEGSNSTMATVSTLSEFSPHGGNASCKYFTKKVVLTEGNDSQDLRVFYTAYRPLNTNILVFYKLLDKNDTSNFDDNGWQLMTSVGANQNVYSTTRDDLIEFESAPGTGGAPDNYITYVSANGQTYTSFIQFAIKVVMVTSDNTTVPFLTDLRALALPTGTGI